MQFVFLQLLLKFPLEHVDQRMQQHLFIGTLALLSKADNNNNMEHMNTGYRVLTVLLESMPKDAVKVDMSRVLFWLVKFQVEVTPSDSDSQQQTAFRHFMKVVTSVLKQAIRTVEALASLNKWITWVRANYHNWFNVLAVFKFNIDIYKL